MKFLLTQFRLPVVHGLMMTLCCAIPLVLLISVSVIDIQNLTLDFLVLLVCPIGMLLMSWSMIRSPTGGAPPQPNFRQRQQSETYSERP